MKTFRAKIGDDNTASIALFKSLNYQEVSHSDVFQETTLELSSSAKDEWQKILDVSTKLETRRYDA